MNTFDLSFHKYHRGQVEHSAFSISPDVRFFTLYAFFTGVLGYNQELNNSTAPERIQLRTDMNNILQKVDRKQVEGWKAYYHQRPYHIWKYLHYTSFLGPPTQFKEHVSPDDMANFQMAENLRTFGCVLSEFYIECGLEELYFCRYKPALLERVREYNFCNIEADLAHLFSYIRLDRNEYRHIRIQIVPLPFESHYVSYASPHADRLYLLDGPGTSRSGLNTHEYLHLIINPEIEKHLLDYPDAYSKEYRANRDKEWIQSDYAGVSTFIAECTVRAVDHRLRVRSVAHDNGEYRKSIERQMAFEAEKGLVLVKEFYKLLEQQYETKPHRCRNIREFIGELIISPKSGSRHSVE